MTRPPQTLYVTIRRDELRQLKDERDQLQEEVLRLRAPVAAAEARGCDGVRSSPL
ncbi:DUF6026 family protein [Pseudomonas fluorescens]|uniref:DUF6026 family protein n=1 Tax=Pseudomonas fluorescens TaxID=294 RepID=UPI0020365C82|nr:DUF6026 family protein [Pseudomonas fluorescens]